MLREGTFDDIPRAAAMRQRAWPESIVTEEGMRHSLGAVPATAEQALFAFEEGSEILGWATAGRPWWVAAPDAGTLTIAVEPSRRGERIGSALAEAADAHLARLGIRRTRAGSLDEPAARALARRRGFAELGASTVSAVDPRTVEPLPVPSDVALVPFAELDDPVPVYELDLEVSKDIPNEEYDAMELEQWIAEFWKTPLVDEDASLAAFVDGRLAAVTMIRVDRPSGRAKNDLAGVRAPYRGRGLAAVIKSHSLRRAAELGATIALTDNDETNAPMLAVNTRLGYRPYARRLAWERALGG
ncbi:MAG TPA: GNAT family N-acetyltransferase [Gaiella sp.]|uniref:GNAT family N-acetyltransferase n=1 Tax=Gaiella sp. TaxID=2663207 RepID=UPI002D7F97FA|nr:GNAT family N-acetyltransferase [Gaiella sp.]HET9287174.1 GNAT family N-acetyltransferase [Gaiella sp.]